MRPLKMAARLLRRATGSREVVAEIPPLPPTHVCVVTGASAGIGLETARGLARAGATVALVGRHPERTARAASDIRSSTDNPRVSHHLADFAVLDQVRALADTLRAAHPQMHVLVNNAGLWHNRRHTSADGFEETLAVNHLAPYLLTRLLLDTLDHDEPSRVVTVSSRMHRSVAGFDFDDPMWERRRYRGTPAYARSKLANIMFANELARRLSDTRITSTSVHPGDVATDVVRDSAALKLGLKLVRKALLTPEEGAQTSLHAAASLAAADRTGVYFDECAETMPSPAARDVEAGRRLWRLTATWVGLPA